MPLSPILVTGTTIVQNLSFPFLQTMQVSIICQREIRSVECGMCPIAALNITDSIYSPNIGIAEY